MQKKQQQLIFKGKKNIFFYSTWRQKNEEKNGFILNSVAVFQVF